MEKIKSNLPKFNYKNYKINLRGAKPIIDNSVKEFILSLTPVEDLYNKNLQDEFSENFFRWINTSNNNKLIGLKNFSNQKLVAGTAQAFDHWYWRHKNKRFRFFKGEFMYHNAVLKNGGDLLYLDEDDFRENDALIISVPFSDWGRQHDMLNEYLKTCDRLNIPVLLDFAYYPCTKNINLDLDQYQCVETVTFSISKAFYGAEYLRVGMRLERSNTDDGIDVFNSVDMINRISLSISNSLIKQYSIDYNWKTYNSVYNKICEDLELIKTDCIMFGLGGSNYSDFNRGGDVNRVCISELIGEEINGIS